MILTPGGCPPVDVAAWTDRQGSERYRVTTTGLSVMKYLDLQLGHLVDCGSNKRQISATMTRWRSRVRVPSCPPHPGRDWGVRLPWLSQLAGGLAVVHPIQPSTSTSTWPEPVESFPVDRNTCSVPSPPRPTIAIFGTTSPARQLRFDTVGWAAPVGHTDR